MSGLRMVRMTIACVLSFMLLGCGLADIDVASVAPSSMYWTKAGVSIQQQEADRVSCVRRKDRPLIDVINDQDECMLKKGYTFIPRPRGYQNVCEGHDPLSNEFACRVWRGEISVQTDQPAPPAPPIHAGPPPQAPDYDRIIPPSSVLQNSVTNQSNGSANRLLNNIRR